MPRKRLSHLYSKNLTFLKTISDAYKGSENNSKIIYHGIVLEVDKIGNDVRAKYSLLVKLIGIDPDDQQLKDTEDETEKIFARYYPPLLPIHIMAIPEVGEEVKIIFVDPGNFEDGYWISREETNNSFTKNVSGNDIVASNDTDDLPPATKYGINDDANKFKDDDIVPDKNYDIPLDRRKTGDVVLDGRSNTYIKQSFDTKNKKGYIESLTENTEVDDSEFFGDEGDDFRKIGGSRSIIATQLDLDSVLLEGKYNLTFHDNYTANGGKKEYDAAFHLIEGDEIRIISKLGGIINHVTLAETQAQWLTDQINILKQLIADLRSGFDNFIKEYSQHTHTTSTGPSSPPIQPDTVQPELDQSLQEDSDNLNDMIDKIKNHHSKNIAVN